MPPPGINAAALRLALRLPANTTSRTLLLRRQTCRHNSRAGTMAGRFRTQAAALSLAGKRRTNCCVPFPRS